MKPMWTREAIAEAMRAWAAEHGRAPVSSDWRKAGYGRPTSERVHRVFGSWRAAREFAGLEFRRVNHVPGSREGIIEAFTRWVFLHGRPPRYAEWDAGDPAWPSVYVVRREFGSWNAGLVAAGYRPERHRRTVDGYRRVAGAAARARAAA